MPDINAKLEIMELLSKYLLCLDERRFDHESFAEIFTDSAEVRCNLSSWYDSFTAENGDSFIAGTVSFSAVKLLGIWKIQRMRRKTQCVCNFGINTKNKEVFS